MVFLSVCYKLLEEQRPSFRAFVFYKFSALGIFYFLGYSAAGPLRHFVIPPLSLILRRSKAGKGWGTGQRAEAASLHTFILGYRVGSGIICCGTGTLCHFQMTPFCGSTPPDLLP